MGEKMYKLRERLEEELDKIVDRGNITAESLTLIDKITHSMKSIDTICAMEEYGEDDDYSRDDGGYSGRYSYARGRGRNAKRDSMGRYARDNGGNMGNGNNGSSYGRRSYRNGRSYDRGYSGDDDMMDMFSEMMDNASDQKEREVIQKMMNQYGR